VPPNQQVERAPDAAARYSSAHECRPSSSARLDAAAASTEPKSSMCHLNVPPKCVGSCVR
jgi:hypothetical protein